MKIIPLRPEPISPTRSSEDAFGGPEPHVCPACGERQVRQKRNVFHVLGGVLVVLVCGACALQTLGGSLIFMIWGIFLINPKRRCRACGWSERVG